MKNEKPYIDVATKHFIIGGKRYVLGKTTKKKIGEVTHNDKILLEEVDMSAEETVLADIVGRMSKGVSLEKLLRQAIKSQLSLGQREKLLKLLKENKGKFEEQEGCYGWAIGKNYFQLFE